MKTRYLVLAIVLLAIVGLTACKSEKKPSTTDVDVASDIQSVTVSQSTVPDMLESVGTLHAAETAQLASQTMGTVVSVNVREGDRVRRGQVLATIDDSQARAGLDRALAGASAADHEAAAADADYGLAEATIKRYQTLFDKRSVSPQEMDEMKARYQAASAHRETAHAGQAQAKAALSQAHTALNYTRILAPFDGIVTERKVDPGALAAPGMELLTVDGSGRFRLEVTVDESSLRHVYAGQTVPVLLDAISDKPFSGKVVLIAPAADPLSRSFLVKIEMPADPLLRSGVFGRAQFPKGERPSILIPRTAVVSRGQLQAVYVIGTDGIASIRYITIGNPIGNKMEVLSGVNSGDRVIAAPGERDLAGKRIEVKG
jgi:RND family efflux transporter MFP subunit